VRGLNAPDTKEKMAAQGMFTTTANVEDFGEFVKKETVRWTQIVKESGVKAE
jgi:tripartite-type tricarboxylate transporter receptor subunit TctC